MDSPRPRPVEAVIDFGAMRMGHLLLSRANDLAEVCVFGLEGLVSKHRDRAYRGGRQKMGQNEEPETSGDAASRNPSNDPGPFHHHVPGPRRRMSAHHLTAAE